MGNEWGSFGNDEDHTFVILGVGRGVRVEAITVVLVAKFFDDRFPLIVFEVGFSKDEDVVGGADVVANGLEFAVRKTANVLGKNIHFLGGDCVARLLYKLLY